jgi:hypothetical protein
MCPVVAVDAPQLPDGLVHWESLDKAGYTLQVTVAAAQKLDVDDAPGVDGEADPLGADPDRCIDRPLHVDSSDASG